MQQSELWCFFVLTLVSLARFAAGLPVSRSTRPVGCSRFSDSISGRCVEYPGYPTQINGINVDFYRYADGWTTPNPTGDLNIAAISNAITTVLPTFSAFTLPFSVTVVLIKAWKDINNTHLAETIADLPDGTPCFIVIPEKPDEGTDPSFELSQTTAHELYHCVEDRNQGTTLPDLDGSGWWIEGSAEYFANRFYPDNRPLNPSSHIKAYDPNVALYGKNPSPLIDQEYSASIFFQFLSNQGWDDNDINGFIIQQYQDQRVGGSERSIMSSNADLQRLFPIFAQKFSALAITFPDGTLAQGNPGTPINEIKIVLDDLQSDGQQHPTSVEILPFAMKTYTATLQPGITYSIQWLPSAQDGKTVLAYQAAADISGNTAWTTFDPASPIQIPIDCSSAPVQYKFLVTSTADVDMSNGQLTFVRQSSQPCSCNDVGISLDPCLSGTWNLDLDEFQIYLNSRLSALQGITVSNLATSGASTFEFPGGGMGGATFSNLGINYDATSSGYSFHITSDETGSMSGQVVMQAAGKFCWADGQGQGLIHTSTTTVGLSEPLVLDVPIATSYVAPTITVSYTCSATSLQLEGRENGLYLWSLSYVKA